ncbi:MAG: hypothetical protein F4047_13635 [Caldilineaceae bacterium SB0670_bin_27]|uniref:Uncharacterized protein n=1 Tax=Caldilineaceae bacterium SB0664_bin_27 TaxID=2605260 RepID=A0A6B0YUQ6_9CHLR|nr:hypothetical protein [Caldilineaceae bacterium SB0664_bin_27]MYJ79154.1 hypothetical protein [Caldilineaceae bacterium SB0670_bin_27]
MYDILYLFFAKWGRSVTRAETTISCVITAMIPGCTIPETGTSFVYIGRQPGLERPFLLNSVNHYKTLTKPVHFRQTTNHGQPHFRADFPAGIGSKTRSRGASNSADFCPKVMHPY